MKKLLFLSLILAVATMASCSKHDTAPAPADYTTEIEASSGVAPSAGTGTATNPFLLSSAANMKWLKGQTAAQTKNQHYKLTTNLNVTSTTWVVDQIFSGNFDGNNKTISGKLISDENPTAETDFFGFFGKIKGGSVKNLNIKAAISAPNRANVGSIVGYMENDGATLGEITKCTNSGAVIGKYNTGGMVGNMYHTITVVTPNTTTTLVSDCTNSADVTSVSEPAEAAAGTRSGGIIGNINIYITPNPTTDPKSIYRVENCTNTGNISATIKRNLASVGGIIGRPAPYYVTLEVKGCTNSGIVKCGEGTEAIIATTDRGSAPYHVALICCENYAYATTAPYTYLIVTPK